MDNIEISENKEATVILISSVSSAVTGFLAASPIPNEWKYPAVALTGTITAAILAYWKAKINNIPQIK